MPASETTTLMKEAFAGFLDCISFDYFCTFTTRKPISLLSCRRIAQKVVYRITRFDDLYFRSDPNASIFWAAEKFELRDGYHFHALIKANIDKYQLWDWYFRRYGRCQIIDNREPDRQLAASYYLSKYITKEISDYDLILSVKHRELFRI